MTLLISGVLIWAAVHLFPAVFPARRSALIGRIGPGPYRGLFALAIAFGIFLIIRGWSRTPADTVYLPPLSGSPVVSILVLVAFILFAAANAPGNIRRWLRHPMLTGVVVWGAAHLLANGTGRDVVLFGGLAAWAILEMVLINLRDGARQKPERVAWSRDVITVVASTVVFGVVAYFHAALFGVAAVPGF